ncbi:MAG: hypothetical protein NZ522_08745 [Chitinophagales bacterium]|nr:hypothetical protein [Chitinophagales bacterium]
MKKFISLVMAHLKFSILLAQPINFTNFDSFSDETVFTQASWTSLGFNVPWVNGFN